MSSNLAYLDKNTISLYRNPSEQLAEFIGIGINENWLTFVIQAVQYFTLIIPYLKGIHLFHMQSPLGRISVQNMAI